MRQLILLCIILFIISLCNAVSVFNTLNVVLPQENQPTCTYISCSPLQPKSRIDTTSHHFQLHLVNKTIEGYTIQSPNTSYYLNETGIDAQVCVGVFTGPSFPFVVNVSVSNATSKVCDFLLEVIPLVKLPPQEQTIDVSASMVAPSKVDFINVTVTTLEARDFNHLVQPVLKILVTGIDIRIDDQFVAQYLGWLGIGTATPPRNILELTIDAPVVDVLVMVVLPGTNVTIHAHELRIAAQAGFSTVPSTYLTIPAVSVAGGSGSPGGNITLIAKLAIISDGAILDVRGGKGQTGGPAPVAAPGVSIPVNFGFSCEATLGCTCVYAYFNYAVHHGHEFCENDNENDRIYGTASCPTSGQDAGPTGRSGNGGNGGRIVINAETINIGAPTISLVSGEIGDGGIPQPGGAAGTPTVPCYCRWACYNGDCDASHCRAGIFSDPKGCGGANVNPCPPTHNGRPGDTLLGSLGLDGSFIVANSTNTTSAWITQDLLHTVGTYMDALNLNNQYQQVLELASFYIQELTAAGDDIGDWVPDWLTIFNKYRLQVLSGLNAFHQPANQVPHLSLEAHSQIFAAVVRPSLEVMYNVWTLLYKNDDREQQLKHLKVVQAAAIANVQALSTELRDVDTKLAQINQAIVVQQKEEEFLAQYVVQLQAYLRREAELDAEKAAELPVWESILKIAAVGMRVIGTATGQVELVGAGMTLDAVLKIVDAADSTQQILDKLPSVYDVYKDATEHKGSSLIDDISKIIDDAGNTDFWNASSVLQTLKSISTGEKKIASIFSAISGLLTERGISSEEIEALYKQKLASNKMFADLSAQIQQHSEKIKQLFAEVSKLTQQSAKLVTGITSNLQLIAKLGAAIISEHELLLEPATRRALVTISQRAQEDVLFWDYMLRVSYYYRAMKPYLGVPIQNLIRDNLFIILANSTANPVDTLVSLVLEQWRSQLLKLISELEFSQGPDKVTMTIHNSSLTDVTEQLNSKGKATFDIRPWSDNMFPGMEQQVIPISTSEPSVEIMFNVSSCTSGMISIMLTQRQCFVRHAGKLYAMNPGDDTPLYHWEIIYDCETKKTTYSQPYPTLASLIGIIVNDPEFTEKQKLDGINERPKLQGEYEIAIQLAPPSFDPPQITYLALTFPFLRVLAPPDQFELYVEVLCSNSTTHFPCSPFVLVTPTDANSRDSSYGTFFRLYNGPVIVELEAAAISEQFIFHHWEWTTGSHRPDVVNALQLSLTLESHTRVRCFYSVSPGPSAKYL